MADNLFKTKSLVEIEECLAKALTELLGQETSVSIAGLQTPQGFVVSPSATFTVSATHKPDYGDGGTF
ncbi:MAG: hypothetical protein ACRYGA_02200 [Janthinobacterium lividum]